MVCSAWKAGLYSEAFGKKTYRNHDKGQIVTPNLQLRKTKQTIYDSPRSDSNKHSKSIIEPEITEELADKIESLYSTGNKPYKQINKDSTITKDTEISPSSYEGNKPIPQYFGLDDQLQLTRPITAFVSKHRYTLT